MKHRHLNLPKIMLFLKNHNLYSTPSPKKGFEMCPNKGHAHKEYRGEEAKCTKNVKESVSAAVHGISFCALCQPR